MILKKFEGLNLYVNEEKEIIKCISELEENKVLEIILNYISEFLIIDIKEFSFKGIVKERKEGI